jgi:DNA-binding XRE family transcriptional regulator
VVDVRCSRMIVCVVANITSHGITRARVSQLPYGRFAACRVRVTCVTMPHMSNATLAPITFTLGDHLRRARQSAGMEQADLARVLGTSRSTVSHYETDRINARRAVVIAWAWACGADPQFFADLCGTPRLRA